MKRLVLKRCVYGVNVSPMGAEIAKVSLWLASFVPGLSLAYLDHNVQVGNSLIGVARPEQVAPPEGNGQVAMFGGELSEAVPRGRGGRRRLRAILDRTPAEVERSREAHEALRPPRRGRQARLRPLDRRAARPGGRTGRGPAPRRPTPRGAGLHSWPTGREGDGGRRAGAPLAASGRRGLRPQDPGFDAVVGNPPWKEVKVNELAFYARYRPGLTAMPEPARDAELARLLADRPALKVGSSGIAIVSSTPQVAPDPRCHARSEAP